MSLVQSEELTGEGLGRERPPGLRVMVLLEGAPVQPVQVRGTILIGRAHDAYLPIPHASVSRRHAILDVDAMTLTDLGSRNGCTVQGERLTPETPMELRPNETIVIGDVTVVLQPDTAPPGTIMGAPVQDLPLE